MPDLQTMPILEHEVKLLISFSINFEEVVYWYRHLSSFLVLQAKFDRKACIIIFKTWSSLKKKRKSFSLRKM
jgi:hypothetical protein